MEEDSDDYYPRTPFWLQSSTNLHRASLNRRRRRRRRRDASSAFLSSGSLVLLLLVAAILFLLFVIPSLFRHYSQNFKPNFVKRSWDRINLVLVLFALAFGFLSKLRYEDRDYQRTGSSSSNGAPISTPSTSHQDWYDSTDQTVGGLTRSTSRSSYPDLRELLVPGGDPWRFSDDTHLNSYRVWNSDHPYRRPTWKELDRQNSVNRDVAHLVNLSTQVSSAPPPRSPSPPSPQSQVTSAPPVARKRTKPTHQSLAQNQGRKGDANLEPRKIVAKEAEDQPSAPPSAAPVMASVKEAEQRNSRRRARRRSDVNANKHFAAAFYIKNQKKWQKHPSVDTLYAQLHHPLPSPLQFQFPPLSPPSPPPPPPPPVFHKTSPTKKDKRNKIPPTTPDIYSYTAPPQPPPPPPPPLFTHNKFTTKKEKRKKIPPTIPATYSYNTPLPPPPPPPPPLRTARESKPTIRKAPFTTSQKPPMPEKIHSKNIIEDWSSGTESNPPPPPLPPFKMRDLKYVVEGDYARLLSTDSSRSGSSDPDEVESDETLNEASPPLFRSKPDVDTKAGNFISNFRAGLKLEKVNSYNKKQALKMSNLGPNPGSSSLI